MTTPPNDDARSSEPVSFDKPASDPAAPGDDAGFDPYRFGAPEHPVPPEYAPPGYVPPPVEQPTAPASYQQYPPYAGGQPPYGQPPYGGAQQPYGGQQPQQQQPYSGGYYPPPPWTQYPAPRTGNGRAIAALVLGIASILFFWTSIFDIVPVVLAIVFGSIGVNDARRGGTGRSMAVSGIVCGVIGALLAITFTVVVYARIKPCLDEYDQGSSAQNTCIRDKF